jgi:hypothetical protein
MHVGIEWFMYVMIDCLSSHLIVVIVYFREFISQNKKVNILKKIKEEMMTK